MCILHKETVVCMSQGFSQNQEKKTYSIPTCQGTQGIHLLYSRMFIIVRTYTGRDLGAMLVLLLVVLMQLTYDGLVSRRLSSTIEN